jgi:hypothetical protein
MPAIQRHGIAAFPMEHDFIAIRSSYQWRINTTSKRTAAKVAACASPYVPKMFWKYHLM